MFLAAFGGLSPRSNVLQAMQRQSAMIQDQDNSRHLKDSRMTYAVVVETKSGREVRVTVTHTISESTWNRFWPELGVTDERWDEWRNAGRMVDIIPGRPELSLLASIDEGTTLFDAAALKSECAAVLRTVSDEEMRDLLRSLQEAAASALAAGGTVSIVPSTDEKVGDQWSFKIDDNGEQEYESKLILAIAVKTQRGREVRLTVTHHFTESTWKRLWIQLGVTADRWYEWRNARRKFPIKPELPTLSRLADMDLGAPPFDLAAFKADCTEALLTVSDEETRGILRALQDAATSAMAIGGTVVIVDSMGEKVGDQRSFTIR